MKFIYNFDIIGPNPKLYIFKSERYKSIFSLLLSIIIIFISIIFIIYSLINYFKYDRPIVTYSKSNDKNEERKIFLNDTLIMFQYIDLTSTKKINESIAYYTAEYRAIFDNGTTQNIELNVESCKYGKNFNSKYAEYIKKKINALTNYFITDKDLEDYYCINSDDPNINFFYLPDIGYSIINLYFMLKNQTTYIPENVSLMIIYENNLFNHDNKNNPISEGISYEFITGFSSFEFTTVNINFQYFKYETDDGLFFENSNYLYGMSFLDMTYYKGSQLYYDIQKNFIENNYSQIGTLSLLLNKANYDYYRRSYKKIQALLAEIMSIVSLLFEIGQQITIFLNEKKMSVDVIRKLYNKDENKKFNKGKLYNNIINIKSDRIKIIPEKINNSFQLIDDRNDRNNNKNNNSNNFSASKISSNSECKIISENKHEKILKNIYIFNIIKSFICNNNKDKLINLCHDIIIEDMCIENILEKFYNLERIYKSILEEEKNNLGLIKDIRFRKINSIINLIYNQYNNMRNNS